METAIGAFDSRDRAEEALKVLIERHIPQESIVFLTRSENEAVTVAKELGAFAGAFVLKGQCKTGHAGSLQNRP